MRPWACAALHSCGIAGEKCPGFTMLQSCRAVGEAVALDRQPIKVSPPASLISTVSPAASGRNRPRGAFSAPAWRQGTDRGDSRAKTTCELESIPARWWGWAVGSKKSQKCQGFLASSARITDPRYACHGRSIQFMGASCGAARFVDNLVDNKALSSGFRIAPVAAPVL